MKKCKVWLFNQYAVTSKVPGGTRHFDFARKMKKSGVEMTIFASSANFFTGKGDHNLTDDYLLKEEDGCRFIYIKSDEYGKSYISRVISEFKFALKIKRVALSIDEKPDVIIGSSPNLFVAYFASIVAKKLSLPFVMEIRDIWPAVLLYTGGFKNIIIYFFLKIIEKKLYRRASKIIILMPGARKYLATQNVPDEKIAWVSNGVNFDYFKGIEPIKNKKFTVVFVGSLNKTNDIKTLLESASILQKKKIPVDFQIIGEGQYYIKWLNLSKKLKLRNVKFTGWIKKTRVFSYLLGSDLAVYPVNASKIFNYGIAANKVFEYMGAGKPVISAASYPEDYIADAKAGSSIKNSDPIIMANEIEKYFQMPKTELKMIGLNSRKYARKHFSIDEMAKHYSKELKKVWCLQSNSY